MLFLFMFTQVVPNEMKARDDGFRYFCARLIRYDGVKTKEQARQEVKLFNNKLLMDGKEKFLDDSNLCILFIRWF